MQGKTSQLAQKIYENIFLNGKKDLRAQCLIHGKKE